MTRRPLLRAACALFVACLAWESTAAEAVRLLTGPNSFGTGWMYLSRNGCFVVTAGHVVKAADNRILRVLVRDGRGREWTTGSPIVLSSDPDVAVLPVVGANDPSACGIAGRSRLNVAGVSERARVLRDGAIETTGRGETLRVPVVPFAARADLGRGEIFAVRPANAGDHVAKGWSGSPVTDDAGLVGIVIEAESGSETALAVRADAIVRLVEAASGDAAPVPPKASPAAASAAAQKAPSTTPRTSAFVVTVLAGESVDPANGPDAVLRVNAFGWMARPQNGSTIIVLRAQSDQTFERVDLRVDPESANRLVGYEVAVGLSTRGGDEFLPINYCSSKAGDAFVSCSFLPQSRRDVRLIISWRGNQPVTIKSVAVR